MTDELSERLLRLPLHYEMTGSDITRVCTAIEDFFSPG